MTIAALTYDGTMFLSITHDPRRLPDGHDLVGHLRAELDSMHHDLAVDR